MNRLWLRAAVLTSVLLGAGAAASLALTGRAANRMAASISASGPVATATVAREWETPEPADPPDPPEPPDPSDDPGIVIFSGGATWLGVRIDDVSQEKASSLRLKEPYGALVTSVEGSSPADRAGLKEDDVVVSYQGQRVESSMSLRRFVRETPAGRTVAIGVIRDGSPKTLNVTIESRRHGHSSLAPLVRIPDFDFKKFSNPSWVWSGGGPRLGISVNELNDQLASYFGVKSGEGVLVTEVMEKSPAERAGLKAGDVILRVDGQGIADASDIHEAIRDKPGKDVELLVMRDHREVTLKATLDSAAEGDSSYMHTRRLKDEAVKQALKAKVEALRESRESMEQQRETMNEARRALHDAMRQRHDAIDRLHIRVPSGALIEI